MPVSLICKSCNTKLRAPDNAVGRTLKCPRCMTAMPVVKAQPPRAVNPLFTCPFCQECYNVESEWAGGTIRCRNCKQLVPTARTLEVKPSLSKTTRVFLLSIGGGICLLAVGFIVGALLPTKTASEKLESNEQLTDNRKAEQLTDNRKVELVTPRPEQEPATQKHISVADAEERNKKELAIAKEHEWQRLHDEEDARRMRQVAERMRDNEEAAQHQRDVAEKKAARLAASKRFESRLTAYIGKFRDADDRDGMSNMLKAIIHLRAIHFDYISNKLTKERVAEIYDDIDKYYVNRNRNGLLVVQQMHLLLDMGMDIIADGSDVTLSESFETFKKIVAAPDFAQRPPGAINRGPFR